MPYILHFTSKAVIDFSLESDLHPDPFSPNLVIHALRAHGWIINRLFFLKCSGSVQFVSVSESGAGSADPFIEITNSFFCLFFFYQNIILKTMNPRNETDPIGSGYATLHFFTGRIEGLGWSLFYFKLLMKRRLYRLAAWETVLSAFCYFKVHNFHGSHSQLIPGFWVCLYIDERSPISWL